jgi:SAM-dependent methyltransferase
MNQSGYLMSGQASELERLQLQAKVWEPAGRTLLEGLPSGQGLSAVDIGCGAMGWLRLLCEWTGPQGRVVGTDIDDKLLGAAQGFADAEKLRVQLVKDDLFASSLEPKSFDLLHSRFQIAPLGRVREQLAAYSKLVKPGGWLVIEDTVNGSWQVNPSGKATEGLIALIERGFAAAGGDLNAGRDDPAFVREVLGVEPQVRAHVLALEPGHPYLRLPLQFATSLRPRLEALVGKEELDSLMAGCEVELARPGLWGTTFTLIQTVARL